MFDDVWFCLAFEIVSVKEFHFSMDSYQLSSQCRCILVVTRSVCPLPYVHPLSWFSKAEKGCIARGISCRQVGGSEAEDMKRRGEGKENFSSHYLLSNVLSNRCLLNTLLLSFFSWRLFMCLIYYMWRGGIHFPNEIKGEMTRETKKNRCYRATTKEKKTWKSLQR